MRLYEKISNFYARHFIGCCIILVLAMLLGIGIGIPLVKIGERQIHRWDGWMWAHQTELVPGIQFNSDDCIGTSNNKYANTFCEEPPYLYKKYWIKKTY